MIKTIKTQREKDWQRQDFNPCLCCDDAFVTRALDFLGTAAVTCNKNKIYAYGWTGAFSLSNMIGHISHTYGSISSCLSTPMH